MTEHFVTLFDSYFLPQGISLYKSLEEKMSKDFILWVLCMDHETYETLDGMNLKKIRLMHLNDHECSELLSVKKTRSKGEYCWTMTPFSAKFVFQLDKSVDRVTYIDADMWLLRDPREIFDAFEASNKNVLITQHAPAPEYDQSEISGKFCVQFITFNREGGEKVRDWWEKRCLEWCYARVENGKFGDQKYLDEWPKIFADDVFIYSDFGAFMAPWNAKIFKHESAIFFHFHGLRIFRYIKLNLINQTPYKIPSIVWEKIYLPYLKSYSSSMAALSDNFAKAKYKVSILKFCKELINLLLRNKKIKFL